MLRSEKRFVGELKAGDQVQISRIVDKKKVLMTYDLVGVEWSGEESEFEYATLSLVGLDSDYVGTQTWYTTEEIRVVTEEIK